MNYDKHRYITEFNPDDTILLYNGLKVHFADSIGGQRRALCSSNDTNYLTKNKALIRCNDCEQLIFGNKLRK
jgi:hypothetical protein